jgi:hypothetical protein
MPRHPRLSLVAAAALAACTHAHAASFDWSSGSFVTGVTAPNPLAVGDVLNILDGGNKFISALTLTNNGTVNWSAATLFFQSGGSVQNNGLWDAGADNALIFNGGAATSFINDGTFRKSAGAGATTVSGSLGFVNRGTVDVASGRIEFQGARFEAGSAFTGAGRVVMASGSNTFAGSYDAQSLVLQGGNHVGEAAVAGGLTRFTGGTLAGGWTVDAGATLRAADGANKFIIGTVLNQGTLDWDTGDALFLQSGGQLVNDSVLEFSRSASVLFNGGAAVAVRNAAGATLRANTGVTLSFGGSTNLANSGTLQAADGAEIRYNGQASFADGSVFSGSGRNVAASGINTWSGTFTSGNLVLQAGNHVGDSAVAQGTTVLSGGVLSGGWTVAAGHTWRGASGGTKLISAGSLLNQGTLDWDSGDSLFLQSSGELANEGLLLARQSTSFVFNGGAATKIDNRVAGTVRAAAGATLVLGSGVGFVNTGTLDAEAGGAIVLQGGARLDAGSRFTGAGTVFADGSNTFAGAQQSANLVLRSGTHTGSAAVVGGTVGLTGGILTGTWTVAAGQTLDGRSGGNKIVSSGTLTNAGTVGWNSGDPLFVQSGGSVVNAGLWTAQATTSVIYNGGAATSFINTGIVRAEAGTTLTLGNGIGFVGQGGTLDAVGDIVVAGGAVMQAGSSYTGSGRVQVDGSNRFAGAQQSANLVLRSGTHTGDAAELRGRTTLTGGVLTGSWTVAAGHTLAVAGGGNKIVAAGTLDNRGRLEWGTGDALFLQSGGALNNPGVVDIGTDGAAWLFNGGAAVSIVNTGLIVKSAGAGSFTVGNGTGFVNQGTVDAASGTIVLPGNFTNQGTLKGTGSFAVAGTLTNLGRVAPGASPGTLALTGSFVQGAAGTFDVDVGTLAASDLFTVSGNATLGGTLALNCWAACSLAVGEQIVILDAAGTLSGNFAGVTLAGFGSGAFDVVYDTGNSRVLLQVTEAVTAVPEPATWALWMAGLAGWLARRRFAVR